MSMLIFASRRKLKVVFNGFNPTFYCEEINEVYFKIHENVVIVAFNFSPMVLRRWTNFALTKVVVACMYMYIGLNCIALLNIYS